MSAEAVLRQAIADHGRRLDNIDGTEGLIAKEAAARSAGDRAIHRRLDWLIGIALVTLLAVVAK